MRKGVGIMVASEWKAMPETEERVRWKKEMSRMGKETNLLAEM